MIGVAQRKKIQIIPVGTDPEEFDLSPDGKTLYVSNEDAGEATIVDLAAGQQRRTVKVGEELEGVRVRPDGRVVYVTSEGDGTIAVIDAGKGRAVKTINVGRRPRNRLPARRLACLHHGRE